MQPAITTLIMFIVIGVVSFVTVVGVALIALGSSGAFSSKGSHVRTITSTVRTTTMISTTTTTTTTTATTTTTKTSDTFDSSMTLDFTSFPDTTLVSDNTDLTATSETVPVPASRLNAVSIYPNGSYSADLTSFSKASDTFALLPVDQTTLSEIGAIDNSSNVIEAGRAQYLYFHLPNSTTGTSARSLRNSLVKRDVDDTTSTNSPVGSNTVTGVAIHFIDDDANNSVIVIPLPNYGIPGTLMPDGIFFHYLSDGSVVVRIEISVPTVLCPKANGKPIDACLSLYYQAYVIVNNVQITSPLSVTVQMACGDVCSLPAGLCSASCKTCDGEQVAGFDTPVTRRYNMGTTAGTFDFYYETYVIKDRITVWNEGVLLFDTTCIGATDVVNITFASSSPFIRVDVEPNCDCNLPNGCGTAWIFQVFCLNLNSTSRSIKIKNQLPNTKLIQKPSVEKATFENYLYKNRSK